MRRFAHVGLAGVLLVTASGCIKLLTTNAAGTAGANNDTYDPPVASPDGTKLAFATEASDLGPRDTNGARDIYVRDLVTGTVTLVSANADDTDSGNGQTYGPVFSPDGRKVAFYSEANDLGPDDPGHNGDLYVRDLAAGTTELISIDTSTGLAADVLAFQPAFSPDGTKVAFTSKGNHGVADTERPPRQPGAFYDNEDVYLRDLVAGTTTLVSANATRTDSGNAASLNPEFSPDGSKVLFESIADNLGPVDVTRGGGPQSEDDIYVHDLRSGQTTLVSVNLFGLASGDGVSRESSFGPDGTVVFTSGATNLGPPASWCVGFRGAIQPCANVYRRDLRTGITTLISVNWTGYWAGNNSSSSPQFSPDGTKILFGSSATDLGTPGAGIHIRDLRTGRTSLVSQLPGVSGVVTFDPTGTKVVFETSSFDLGVADPNGTAPDVVVVDVLTRQTYLVSLNTTLTATGNDWSGAPVFVRGGQQVAFLSLATDLVALDTNGRRHLYVGVPHPVRGP